MIRGNRALQRENRLDKEKSIDEQKVMGQRREEEEEDKKRPKIKRGKLNNNAKHK